MMRVEFTTVDGVRIVGTYQEGLSGRAALLLHMMPETKESWDAFSATLVARGFATLAIDLRGHGESVHTVDGRVLDKESFTDEDHQAKRLDVEAALRWFGTKGIARERIALVGASIGANLAIDAATDGVIPATVALSPGLDYRGVQTTDAVLRMTDTQRLLLVASADDAYSFSSAQDLAASKGGIDFRALEGAGHGTRMFDRAPGLLEDVAVWLDAQVQ